MAEKTETIAATPGVTPDATPGATLGHTDSGSKIKPAPSSAIPALASVVLGRGFGSLRGPPESFSGDSFTFCSGFSGGLFFESSRIAPGSSRPSPAWGDRSGQCRFF